MKSIILILFIVMFSFAEEWKIKSNAVLSVNQNSYSDNWEGGESGNVSWVFNLNSSAEKQLSSSVHNSNTLKLSFGQTHSQDEETKNWKKPVKSTDEIELESILKFTLGTYVDPFVSLKYESMFLDESQPEETRLFNPATFTETAGISKTFIKSKKNELSGRLGAASRQFINRDVMTGPDKKETKSRVDLGISFVTEYRTVISKVASFTSKLTLYQAFYNSKSEDWEDNDGDEYLGDRADYWKTADLDWENILSANIAKYLTVNLTAQLVYDKEISLKGRFKETLSLGFTYDIY